MLRGRIQADADKPARLTAADSVVSFDSVPRRLWLRFDSLAEYERHTGMSLLIFSKNRTVKTQSQYIVWQKNRE